MSILIKGMEMPKNCWDCPFAASSYYAVHEYNKRLEWCCILTKKTLTSTKRNRACPLVPVPPHGRLLKVLKTERECVSRDCDRNCGKCDLSLQQSDILTAYDALIAMFDEPAEEGA